MLQHLYNHKLLNMNHHQQLLKHHNYKLKSQYTQKFHYKKLLPRYYKRNNSITVSLISADTLSSSKPRVVSTAKHEYRAESTLLDLSAVTCAFRARVWVTSEGALQVVRFALAYIPICAFSARVIDRRLDKLRRFRAKERPLAL